ncbi:MAG: hypothetical protein AAF360_07250 [Pseudomonadota bacterium]
MTGENRRPPRRPDWTKILGMGSALILCVYFWWYVMVVAADAWFSFCGASVQ